VVNFFIERKKHTAKYYLESLGNGIDLEMVMIPEGEFMMGAPETELMSTNNERPQHLVNVTTIFMGRYPITQEQFREIMGHNPSEFKGNKRPVERISWLDTQEFCDRLTQNTNRDYRLPTEAAWEYACRAGTKTPFHNGETISTDLVNYNGEYFYGSGIRGEYREKTTEVGKFPANEFGLCDMHGNIWEWCEDDWHENYEDTRTNIRDWSSEQSSKKAIRGGCWANSPSICRSANRRYTNRNFRYNYIGFRVICNIPMTPLS